MGHQLSPFAQSGAVAGRQSPPLEPRSAFERVFNPTKGGIFGLIGDISGSRSRTTVENAQALDARSTGLSTLAHQLSADETGLNTQRIVLDFLNSEAGRQGLATDDQFLSKVKAMVEPSTLTPSGRARRDLAGALPDVSVEDVASVEFQKMQQDLLTLAQRDLTARAETLGVPEKSLLQLDQALLQMELDDPTGSQRAFKLLADQLGITEDKLREINLARKQGELIKLQRQNEMTTKTRERLERAEAAGTTVEELAKTEVLNESLEPAVREMIQLAAQTGKTEAEQQELIKKAALAKLVVESGGRTQQERAFLGLIEKELVSKTEAEFVLAGVIELVPVMNTVGEPTGDYDLVNTLSGDVRRLTGASAANKRALQGMVGAGGAGTQAVGAPATEEAPAPESRVPADIIDRTGVVSKALAFALGFVEQVTTPTAITALRKEQENQLTIIENAFRDYATGEGRLLKIEAATLVPIVDNIKLGKSSNQVGGSLLAMHNYLDTEQATARRLLKGPNQEFITDTQRERLSAAFVSAEIMRAQLPTREALQLKLKDIQSKPGLKGATEALDEVEGVLGVEVPGLRDGAVAPLTEAPTAPPGALPPAAPLDASGMPPAGASDPVALPTEAEPSFFDDMNLEQFVPPALRVRADEFDALVEVIPEPVRNTVRQITNIGVGFNVALAEFASIPPEVVNEALIFMGAEGFSVEPGDALESLMSAFEAVGFVPPPGSASIDSFAAGLGRDVFNATIATAVYLAAAPFAAAAEGLPVVQYVGKSALQFAADYPVLFGATSAGAAVGPRTAMGLFGSEDMSPELRALLETAGAFGGGAVAGSLFAGPKALLTAVIPKRPFMKKPPADEQGVMNISPLRVLAREQVDVDIKKTNNDIRWVIEQFAPGVLGKGKGAGVFSNPERAIARLGTALRRVEAGPARLMERQKWAKIEGKRDMTPGLPKIVRWAQIQIKRTGADTRASEIPEGAVRKIMNWEQVAEDGTKTFRKRSISDLLKLRSTWLERIRNPKTTTQHRAFYKKAQRRLLTEIERQYPNDPRVQEALAYSRWLNDRFFGGALEGFMLRQSGGDFDPEKAIGTLVRLIRTDGGAPSVTVISDIAGTLNRPQLMETARSFIRNEFGAIARDLDAQAVQGAGPGLSPRQTTALGRRAGATAGQKFLNSKTTKAFAEAFPKVKVETDLTMDRLTNVLRAQTAVEETAFAAFAGTNTRDAVQTLMASPIRVDMVRELVSRMPSSARGVRPNSLDALRNGMVDWLFRSTNVADIKPSTVIAQLNQPGIRQVFTMVYSPSEMRRLDRILASAMAVQTGTISMAARIFNRTVGTGAKVAGAIGGRFLDTGTIQVPGMFSQLAGDIVSRLVNFGSPARLLALAMTDSNMERMLLSQIPKNLTEVKKLTDLMRFVTVTIGNATRLPVSNPDPGVAQ